MNYQHYRKSTVGEALEGALKELRDNDLHLSNEQILKIWLAFDRIVNAKFATIPSIPSFVFHAGMLSSYRYCDNVWTFIFKDGEFLHHQKPVLKVPKLKFVACEAPMLEHSKRANKSHKNKKAKH